jgi:hypothetical protein
MVTTAGPPQRGRPPLHRGSRGHAPPAAPDLAGDIAKIRNIRSPDGHEGGATVSHPETTHRG